LISCEENEDTSFSTQTIIINNVELIQNKFSKVFSKKKFEEELKKTNLKVNWNDYAITQNSSNSISYEFSTNKYSVLSLDGIKSNKKQSKKNLKLYSVIKVHVTIAENDELDFKIIQYYGDNKKAIKKVNLNNLENFNGTVYYRDISGKLDEIEVYKNGIIVNKVNGPDQKENIKYKEAPVGGEDDLYPMLVHVFMDNWAVASNSSSVYFRFIGSEYLYTYTLWVPQETSGYGTFHEHETDPPIGHSSGGGIDPDIDTHEEEIILAPSFINTKADCIYNKLNGLSQSFKGMIKKFDGEFPVSHLMFTLEDLGNTKGETRAPDGAGNSPDYVITIVLNNNSSSEGIDYRPNLMNVKTIAHEVIHAEMYRKLLSVLDNGGTIAGVTKQMVLDALDGNFPGMYDYFRRHKNWQHQQMATHYRETIAGMLQEFDTGVTVPNNQQPQQIYMDLSWEGLIYEQGDNAIYTWTSLSESEKIRIKKVIADYINNNKNENCQQ